MWHSSANNPDVSKDVLKHWNTLIDEWVKDKSVPLIVRKTQKCVAVHLFIPQEEKLLYLIIRLLFGHLVVCWK